MPSRKNVVHLPCTPEEQFDTLTTKGREQAAALGNFLRDKDIVAIQSSPAGRTRETAQAMSEILGLPEGFEVEEAFSSLRGGKEPDGNPVSWAWREQQWSLGKDPRPEGGESLSDGEIRVRGPWKSWLNGLRDKPSRSFRMAIYAPHCWVLPGIRRYPIGMPLTRFLRDPSANSS